MRIFFKRIVSFILIMCLLSSIFFSRPMIVHASLVDDIKTGWEKFDTWATEKGLKFFNIIPFAAAQLGAIITDRDFSKFVSNESAFLDYWNDNHVTLNDNGSISFDKEFMQWLKGVISEYYKTEQTYTYGWSTGIDDIPYTTFGSWKVCYDTISNVLDTVPSGAMNLIITTGTDNGVFYAQISITAYDNLRDVGFVRYSNTVDYAIHYSMSTWEIIAPDVYSLKLYTGDNAISSWEEFKEKATVNQYLSNGNNIRASDNYRRYSLFCNEKTRNNVPSMSLTNTRLALVTRARTTFRLFRSSDYLFDYSLDKRGIYFASDFWDYEPGDVTFSYDDLNDSLDRMDDILERLLDKIDSTTDEKTIEDLLQQILDELKNGNSGNGNTGTGGNSSSGNSKDYSNFFEMILYYLDLIVDYLAGILEGIENLVFLEWTGQDDSNYTDLSDLWKGIKENPETGSQAAADALTSSFSDIARGLTKKFPFSIPWDLYALFTVFSETDTPQKAEINVLSNTGYSKDGGIQSISIDTYGIEQEIHDAPYFKLPIKVESFGIYEEITVDMKDFQTLSTLSRTLFSLIFAVFLLKFTLKIMSIFGLFGGGD